MSTEVCRGAQRYGGIQRYTEGYTEVCGGALFVLGSHWLPLATIDLVDDDMSHEL